ncbi:MAG: DUF1572 family protein [Polaribacter sp.]|nr:DUF1572 family protein [Polaribacter sp.]
MNPSYLSSVKRQFAYYKSLADKTLAQLTEKELFWHYNEESNSVAILVKHVVGNMHSRWTNFLTEEGEKPWRNRDDEFINSYASKQEMLAAWEKGWGCLFEAIHSIHEEKLDTIVYIRNEGHTVTEAINRQLCHYSYHIGQLVFLGKMVKNSDWKSLSISKSDSKKYNAEKFNTQKGIRHFTEDL